MCMHILQGRPTKFSTFKDAVLQVEEASTLYQKIKASKTHMTSDDIRRAVFPTARVLRDIIHPDSTVEDRARARAVTALEDYKNLALYPEATASGLDIDEILKTLYYHLWPRQPSKVLWSLDLHVRVKEMKLGKLLHPCLVVLLSR